MKVWHISDQDLFEWEYVEKPGNRKTDLVP